MKKILFFLTVLLTINHVSFSQNRNIARGAVPGELYFIGGWYGTLYFNDTLRCAIYHLTENGKKLTMQCDVDCIAVQEDIMAPDCIIADATPGVVYNKNIYSKDSYDYSSLWISFDYGKNWIFREENIGSNSYISSNIEGLIYRGGYDGIFKSEDYGNIFSKFEAVSIGEPGLQYGEGWKVRTTALYQGKILHSYDFFETYTEFPIDSTFLFGSISGSFPDSFCGALPGEVYVSSCFPGGIYKISFSFDFGHTFRQVYKGEWSATKYSLRFMSDREPGVFYIIKHYNVEDNNHGAWHTKICVEYYRDYGEILEATFCHDIHKNYEYEEVICENTTHLETNVEQNSIQLQWTNTINNSCIRGYHIYRNNERITQQLLTDSAYLDENLLTGNYEYYVRTYYKEGCVSDSSNHIKESIEVGIKEMGVDKIVLYPNPTFNTVTIETNNFSKVEIYSAVGQLLKTALTNIVSLSSYKSGVYFLKVFDIEGNSVVRRVVVVK